MTEEVNVSELLLSIRLAKSGGRMTPEQYKQYQQDMHTMRLRPGQLSIEETMDLMHENTERAKQQGPVADYERWEREEKMRQHSEKQNRRNGSFLMMYGTPQPPHPRGKASKRSK